MFVDVDVIILDEFTFKHFTTVRVTIEPREATVLADLVANELVGWHTDDGRKIERWKIAGEDRFYTELPQEPTPDYDNLPMLRLFADDFVKLNRNRERGLVAELSAWYGVPVTVETLKRDEGTLRYVVTLHHKPNAVSYRVNKHLDNYIRSFARW